MKKDWIFAPILIAVGVLLFLLKTTGMNVHMAISVVGLVVLIVYTVLSKKEWKIPVLEVLMRVSYGIALISGIVIMKLHGVAALAIVHKVGAALFLILFVCLFVHKLIAAKKN